VKQELTAFIWPALVGVLAAALILDKWVLEPQVTENAPVNGGYRDAVALATPSVVNIYTAKLSNGFLNHSIDIFTLRDINMTECCNPSLTENQIDILGSSLLIEICDENFSSLFGKFSSSSASNS